MANNWSILIVLLSVPICYMITAVMLTFESILILNVTFS